MTEVTLIFAGPSTYTYAGTRWLGSNHWRMRGTIEVLGEEIGRTADLELLPHVALGIDLDAEHEADLVPAQPPSA